MYARSYSSYPKGGKLVRFLLTVKPPEAVGRRVSKIRVSASKTCVSA